MKTLDWKLAKAVSRSFYLSLRFLPASVRESVALAYLLARASDTVADCGDAPLEIRLRVLRMLGEGKWNEGGLAAYFAEGFRVAEQKLLQAVPELLFRVENHRDADLIRDVFRTILSGQTFDIGYFSTSNAAPLSRDMLEDYTWRVAGCVGKFWTQVCFRHISNVADLSEEKMIECGIEYGKGLQLVNILRDRSEDRVAGRFYFRGEDQDEVFQRAETALASARTYTLALRNRRVRFCSRMPYEIARPTLELVRRHSGFSSVRIPRNRVYALAIHCFMDAVFCPKR